VSLLTACIGEQPDPKLITDDYILFQQAETMRSEIANHVPERSGPWLATILPDNWGDSRSSMADGKWYRFPVSLAAAEEKEWMVFLPRMIMNASVWWDGQLIGSGGRMDSPMARNWYRPLSFILSTSLLSEGEHWLHIYVRAALHDNGGLGHVYIGDLETLTPLFERAIFFHITLSMAALVITIILILVMGALWLLHRQQTEFGWMAISGIFWSIVIANHILKYPPLSQYTWEWLVQSAIGWYAISLMMVVHRFIELRRPLMEKVIVSYFLLATCLAYLFAEEKLVDLFNIIHGGTIALGGYLAWVSYFHYYRTKNSKALWMGAAITFLLAVAIHDWLMMILSEQVSNILIMHFGPPIMMLFIGGWIIFHVSSSLEYQGRYGKLMEQQVERVSSELQQEHQKRLTLEHRQTLLNERQRFTRELHDGMGGHLVAIKSMLGSTEHSKNTIAKTMDQALLDMRLVIDTIDDDRNNIGMTLGTLRSRMEQQLHASGLEVSWNMVSLPFGCELESGLSIHLMRLIQEAITNVVRHADASWVDIRASVSKQDGNSMACIEIADNGKGISPDVSFGRGIGNMQQRCAYLGGNLVIKGNAAGGTLVQAIFPCQSV
jgi:signal transduction histidine kinase